MGDGRDGPVVDEPGSFGADVAVSDFAADRDMLGFVAAEDLSEKGRLVDAIRLYERIVARAGRGTRENRLLTPTPLP